MLAAGLLAVLAVLDSLTPCSGVSEQPFPYCCKINGTRGTHQGSPLDFLSLWPLWPARGAAARAGLGILRPSVVALGALGAGCCMLHGCMAALF